MIRVVIADDQALVRAGVRMLLEAAGEMEVCGEAVDGSQALQLAERLRPDVLLMDLRMPVMDGLEASRRILGAWPAARIVILTTFAEDENVYAALRAGAIGFLVKDDEPERMVDAVRRAASGSRCSPLGAAPRGGAGPGGGGAGDPARPGPAHRAGAGGAGPGRDGAVQRRDRRRPARRRDHRQDPRLHRHGQAGTAKPNPGGGGRPPDRAGRRGVPAGAESPRGGPAGQPAG
nr:hypothetical protein GCM10020093_015580 [Planobispora longispora]